MQELALVAANSNIASAPSTDAVRTHLLLRKVSATRYHEECDTCAIHHLRDPLLEPRLPNTLAVHFVPSVAIKRLVAFASTSAMAGLVFSSRTFKPSSASHQPLKGELTNSAFDGLTPES